MPVYNCKEYLRDSIDSVLKQTIEEWELICVDDGSADESLSILQEYQKKDGRIKIFTQENKGAGEARNLGLKNAVGEYVAFLDADDFYLDADALGCMYMTCKEQAVNACGTKLSVLRNETIGEDIIFTDVQSMASEGKIMNYEEFQFDYGYYCFVFERKLIIENNIKFPPHRRFQDPPFFTQVMYAAKQFCFIDKALYCYRSPNTAVRFNQEKLEGLLNGLIDNLQFAQEHGLNILFDKTLRRLEYEYAQIICHNISEQSVGVLQLLCKANGIIQKSKGPNYIVKPLKRILSSVSELDAYERNAFLQKLMDKNRIYIYGAGKQARDFITYLKCKNMFAKVAGVLVSDTNTNPKDIDCVAVSSADEYSYQNGDIVVIAVSGFYQEEIVNRLKLLNVREYELLNIGIFDE